MFTLQQASSTRGLPGLVTSEEVVRVGTSRFDMSWNLVEPTVPGADALLDIEFNTDLFDGESIARFARHYDQLLRTLTADPDAPLSAADMAAMSS